MKCKVIITLLMFLFVGNVGNAQSFRDNNNMLLGKVESDGTVRNANNMRLGKIYDDASEIRTTCDWGQSVLTASYVIITICVLELSTLMVLYATITI